MWTALLMVLAAEPDWKLESNSDGVTLESRPVEGSVFYEYRARAEASAGVDSLCDGVFEWASVGTDHPHLVERKLLVDKADLRVVHDLRDPPLVSKRELTFSLERKRPGDGSCRIDYEARNDLAPKTAEGFVRIEKLKGGWRFEPLGPGKTLVTYLLFNDPAGSVPAILVHNSQRAATIETLKQGLTKTRK